MLESPPDDVDDNGTRAVVYSLTKIAVTAASVTRTRLITAMLMNRTTLMNRIRTIATGLMTEIIKTFTAKALTVHTNTRKRMNINLVAWSR